jgi:hypothetical protein
MSADTHPADLANPQSLDRYAYVFNNPINFTDELGLWPGGCKLVSEGSSSASGVETASLSEAATEGGGMCNAWMYNNDAGVDQTNGDFFAFGQFAGQPVLLTGFASGGYINWTTGGTIYNQYHNPVDAAGIAEAAGLPSTVDTGASTWISWSFGTSQNGGGTGGPQQHTCQQNRILNAIPGATLTGSETDEGGHHQVGINTTGAQLAAAGLNSFSLFGFVPNGYRDSNVFWSIHVNAFGGVGHQLTSGGPFNNVQGHIDLFNPNAPFPLNIIIGMPGHGVWDLGIGTLFFHHSSRLDPRC